MGNELDEMEMERLIKEVRGYFSSLNGRIERIRYNFRESTDRVLIEIRELDYQLNKISGRLN